MVVFVLMVEIYDESTQSFSTKIEGIYKHPKIAEKRREELAPHNELIRSSWITEYELME